MAAKSDGSSCCSPVPPVLPLLPGPASLPPGPGAAASRASVRPAAGPRYSVWDFVWTVCALLVFFWDGASDLWLAADYYLRTDYRSFGLTVLLLALPSAVVQLLSFRWFAFDFSEAADGASAAAVAAVAAGGAQHPQAPQAGFSTKDSGTAGGGGAGGEPRGAGRSAGGRPGLPDTGGGGAGTGGTGGTGGGTRSCCRGLMWLFQAVIHIFQLAQVWRYVHALYLGVQSRWHGNPERRHYYWRMMFESADISMLRLLESFLKSAPQLVLQLSIMVRASQVLPLQGLSASASLVSLAWMISSYQKVLRDSRDDKLSMSYKAAAVLMLWHVFTIGARTLAFALFASVFQLYFGIFIVSHWCIMTFWIIQGETDFCMSKWEEIIYNMMVGVIYVFCWFSVREGRTRCRMLIYSVMVLAENVALTAAWYLHRGPRSSDFYAVVLVCVVASSYALGTFFMFVYYCLLHPDGAVSAWAYVVEKELPVEPLSPAATSPPPPDLVSSPPRTLQRTKGPDREAAPGMDGDVFQVRPPRGAQVPALNVTPRTEGPVIRIDLPRKKYPAWDAHYIDRRLRRTILVLEGAAPVTPRIQYRCLGTPKEVMEYETTV